MTKRLTGDFASWKWYFGSGCFLCIAAALMLCCVETQVAAQDALTVHVYGPGGPGPAMNDCARRSAPVMASM
jgi:hypothetical protein